MVVTILAAECGQVRPSARPLLQGSVRLSRAIWVEQQSGTASVPTGARASVASLLGQLAC